MRIQPAQGARGHARAHAPSRGRDVIPCMGNGGDSDSRSKDKAVDREFSGAKKSLSVIVIIHTEMSSTIFLALTPLCPCRPFHINLYTCREVPCTTKEAECSVQ